MDAGCRKKNRRTDAPVFFTAHFFCKSKKNVPPLAPAVRVTCNTAHRKKPQSRIRSWRNRAGRFLSALRKGGAGVRGRHGGRRYGAAPAGA
jgi:hypothetical protein